MDNIQNLHQPVRTAGPRQLRVPVFFMEEHLSAEQIRLETEVENAAHFMKNDYEQSREKFERAGMVEDD